MNHDELVRAARELIAAASEPIRYPASSEYGASVLVPENLLDFLKDALESCPQPTPFVSIDPLFKAGTPCLRGTRLPVELIAERYWELGEHLGSELLSAYEITRADVLACCFYVAEYGTKTQRKRWKPWLAETWVQTRTGGGWWSEGWGDVPLPPHTRTQEAAPS
jgi:uncharacterized protein (DUF433 family)